MKKKLEKIKQLIADADNAPAFSPATKMALAKQALSETQSLLVDVVAGLEALGYNVND